MYLYLFLSDDFKSEECYREALSDLADPLLPTRGHALKQLSKLLRHRNKWAMDDRDKIFEIFETNLTEADTYLYLAAVDGLTSLADVYHKTVIPLLCQRFIEMREKGNTVFLVFQSSLD